MTTEEKPKCLCGHSHVAHTWGTSFCACYKSLDEAGGEMCGCKQYREGLCACNHAWPAHSITHNTNLLWCPFCGICCDHWNRDRRDAGVTTEQLVCQKCIFKRIEDNKIEHHKDCPLQPGSIETNYSNSSVTLQQWQKEIEEEERNKPECFCGHGYGSHYEEKDKLPCAECWEDITKPGEAKTFDTTCKDYSPKKSAEFSEDPAVVNAEALKQIGDTGKMTPEEIQKRIDEWKEKQKLDAKTGTVTKIPSQAFGGTYHGGGDDFHGYGAFAKCSHNPSHVINGKTWHVYAGTKSNCLSSVWDYDVILNVSNGMESVPKHQIPFKWGEKYTSCKTKEIMMDWPDGSIPVIPYAFWKDLKNHLVNTKGKMLVFCLGGHGRTGTAIACLMVACGWSAGAAKAWIRRNYCKEAIETQVQEDYISRVEQAFKEKKKDKSRK